MGVSDPKIPLDGKKDVHETYLDTTQCIQLKSIHATLIHNELLNLHMKETRSNLTFFNSVHVIFDDITELMPGDWELFCVLCLIKNSYAKFDTD